MAPIRLGLVAGYRYQCPSPNAWQSHGNFVGYPLVLCQQQERYSSEWLGRRGGHSRRLGERHGQAEQIEFAKRQNCTVRETWKLG